MYTRKKFRSKRRIHRKIERWTNSESLALNLDYYKQHGYWLAKATIPYYSGLYVAHEPPSNIQDKILNLLVRTYMHWQDELNSKNVSREIVLRLNTTKFVQSRVIVSNPDKFQGLPNEDIIKNEVFPYEKYPVSLKEFQFTRGCIFNEDDNGVKLRDEPPVYYIWDGMLAI